jgi:hypothetical protein
MSNIVDIIVVNHKEFKNIKKNILSSMLTPRRCKYSKGQKIKIKKTFFNWFLYASIEVEIVDLTKDVLERGFRSQNVLIIFKKLK